MAVPKKRTSSARRDKRRAHDKLMKINISFDKSTGDPALPHHLALRSGYYNKMQVLKKGKDDIGATHRQDD